LTRNRHSTTAAWRRLKNEARSAKPFADLARLADRLYTHPQHTGVPFIIMQHMQPAFIMVAMQSQQA
jgi:hypothetical protein